MHVARLCLVSAIWTCGALFEAPAAFAAPAPIGWDVAAEVGAMKRFTTGGAATAPNPGLGVAFELQGHVALLPMVRLGAYAEQDVSPASGIPARQFWAGGLHVKFMPPLMAPPWHPWAFAGLGYVSSHAPGYTQDSSVSGGPLQEVRIRGMGGGFLEVPVGVGLGYRFRRPWEIFAQLGARFGFAFSGSIYEGGATESANGGGGSAPAVQPFAGKDSFALSVSLGLSLVE